MRWGIWGISLDRKRGEKRRGNPMKHTISFNTTDDHEPSKKAWNVGFCFVNESEHESDWMKVGWVVVFYFFAISTWKIFVVWSRWPLFLPTAFVQHDSELMVNAWVSLWMLQPTAGQAKRCLSIYQACLKGSRNVVGNIHEGCWIFTSFFTVEAWCGNINSCSSSS